MAGSRDVFPLRFKNPRTRGALRHLSEETGVPMTDIAERAIEHEVALQGADLERRLEEALDVVRSYRPETDLGAYLDAAAEGERGGIEPFDNVRAAHAESLESRRNLLRPRPVDHFGVLAAFQRP